MIVSEYVLLEIPERFWLWYSVIVPVLLGMRYPSYVQRKWHLFYLDFCYYVQVLFGFADVYSWEGTQPPRVIHTGDN